MGHPSTHFWLSYYLPPCLISILEETLNDSHNNGQVTLEFHSTFMTEACTALLEAAHSIYMYVAQFSPYENDESIDESFLKANLGQIATWWTSLAVQKYTFNIWFIAKCWPSTTNTVVFLLPPMTCQLELVYAIHWPHFFNTRFPLCSKSIIYNKL